MRLPTLIVSLAALSLAACDDGTGGAAAEGDAMPSPTATTSPLPAEIPVAFQGRWGLSAEDCTAEPDAETGLMTVDADGMDFYESAGTLEEVTGATTDRFRGNFAFTGEGMSWQRDAVFDLREDGDVLVRREFGEGASPEPFEYTRCP